MKWKLLIIIFLLGIIGTFYFQINKRKEEIKITHITEKVFFTDKYDKNTSLCLPAAYTNKDGSIQGEYMIDGVSYGTPVRKERVSIHPTKGLIVSGQWHSKNGFQQSVLVKNGKVRKFKDTRKRVRRALCCDDSNKLYIIESTYRMTLAQFAELASQHCRTVVNLDTGCYGYGWYDGHKCHRWAFYNKHKQTNWICCE